MISFSFDSFTDLKEWADNLPDQQMGRASAISDEGQPYVVFQYAALARPNDVKTVQKMVATQMALNLRNYFANKLGKLYWRTKIETEIKDQSVIIRANSDGVDVDFITNTRVDADHDWKQISVYCRLYKSDKLISKAA